MVSPEGISTAACLGKAHWDADALRLSAVTRKGLRRGNYKLVSSFELSSGGSGFPLGVWGTCGGW